MKNYHNHQFVILVFILAVFFTSCKKNEEDNNLGPEISVNDDIIGMTGQTISLSVIASDPDGDALEYTWQIIESPTGSVPVLSNSSNSNATFTTPTAGLYRIEVVVEDGKGGQASGVIRLSIGGVLPTNITSVMVLPDLFADPNIPDYYVNSTTQVREGLTLAAGVVVECASDAYLNVIGNPGFLKAEGTAANKVIFRGVAKVKGSWRGIGISSTNINNSLNHVEIMHAGSSNNGDRRAALRLQGNTFSRLVIQNTTISETAGHGLYLDGRDAVLTLFANNIFSNNDLAPVRLGAEQLYSLDRQSVYTGNGIQAVEVASAGNTTGRINNSGIVPKLNVPYHFLSSLELMDAVTFEPGVTCLFNSGLIINVNAVGAIIANGTASEPITFSGLSQVSGAWNGIQIASPSSQNLLNYANVSYGGSTAGRGANIYMFGSSGGSQLTVTNSTISYSQTYGIRRASGNAQLTESNNTFISNALGDVRQD